MSKVLYAPMAFSRYEASQTLPEKFSRLLKASGIAEKLKGKSVAIKMHVGAGISYSTIPLIFVKKLVDFVKDSGGNCFITDHYIAWRHPEDRGYTESNLGCPVLDCCSILNKYYYTKEINYKSFKHVDIAGLIHDADYMIDFSHVKGHGACAYGGACKNISMGCVTDRTRHEQHALEGGLTWNKDDCIHCKKCIEACNHFANKFNDNDDYEIFYHHCTMCQHCVKICPTNAIKIDNNGYEDFQTGLAICTKEVLNTFEPDNVYYINVLTSITALCDCWGLTTPSLVPDIGIMASGDIVSVEQASIDSIKIENLIPVGIPEGYTLTGSGHLFEQLHGKSPYAQVQKLAEQGLGEIDYKLVNID